MKPLYIKQKHSYWFLKSANKHSMRLWYTIIIAMALFVIWALINHTVNSSPLISPVYIPTIKKAEARETIRIPCERDVASFLECKAIQGEITHKQAQTMLAIAKAESGLNERARNKTSSARGVFQIIAGTWYSNDCVGDKYQWKDNTICAIKIMKSSGYYPWAVYNSGVYKRFM